MDFKQRIAELEDTVKQRDARIKELIEERDAERALVAEAREHVEDASAMIDRWVEAFDMELDDNGIWCLPKFASTYDETRRRYLDLLAKWNKFVPQYNAVVAPKLRNFGRPLCASPAQRDNVLERRKEGQSLRLIAGETGLSLRTVRTIIEKANGTDRSTTARLQRIYPDKLADAGERARKRTRDALPRDIAKLRKSGEALSKKLRGVAGTHS